MDKIDLDKELDKINRLSEKEVDEIFENFNLIYKENRKAINNIIVIITIIKGYKYGRLLLNKTRQIVYFNCFVSVFRV